MVVRLFKVVEEHSSPDAFSDYLYGQLGKGKGQTLHLQAVEQLNELAERRGNPPQTFELVVREIYRDAQMVNTREAQSHEWITILVKNDGVYLELHQNS